jgi:hypothetical protein
MHGEKRLQKLTACVKRKVHTHVVIMKQQLNRYSKPLFVVPTDPVMLMVKNLINHTTVWRVFRKHLCNHNCYNTSQKVTNTESVAECWIQFLIMELILPGRFSEEASFQTFSLINE